MNYTLHQLEVFYKVSEKQSITKASEELHLTQPAVSIQLKNFQEQFPIALTEVVGRKLYITDFGREIAEVAERILNEAEAINFKMRSYGGALTGRLKISVVSTGKYVMPYFLSGFMHTHTEVDLLMDVTNKLQVVESLEKNEVDFALVSVLPNHLKLNNVALMPNILHMVANPKYYEKIRLSKKTGVGDTPLIFREFGSATRGAMEGYLKEREIILGKKIELTSNEAVKQAVLAGLGCSVMPLIGIKNGLQSGKLKIFPMKKLPIITTWNLVWLQKKKLSPVATAFLEYIENEKNQIINADFKWLEAYGNN
ncbi:LysR family transcriptional regulator [Allomuricauda sp. d1]|uniref:LysR family transcriptional regulator n=1 Tax=Allomuricauda sp. d1 TaxID=3136725 RepID=UPI0031DEAD71